MKYPLITMSAITGDPTEDDIFSYMRSLCENGIKQAMLYPRSGCEVEYLGERWFEIIESFIRIAEKLGMSVWIYDDFNWPSGEACGRVTKIEEYRLKTIEVRGDNIGKITVPSVRTSSMFDEKFLPDLFSEKAVDYFIKCTHEEYYERFGEYFGSTIKGFFTDEPSVACCCTDKSIPYYDGMKDDYDESFGRSFDDDMHKCSKKFLINVSELIGKRFTKSFTERISRWCEARNVLLTGHLLSDSTPGGAIRQNGDFLLNLSTFSMPGIDDIFTDLTSVALLPLLASAEYACGKNGAMAELFALGPADMTYGKKLCMLYLTACFKIGHWFLAISPLDIRGSKFITDYFNVFTNDQPDFGGMKIFAKEAERASEYAEKDYTAQVYLRYPTKESASRILDKSNDDPYFNIAARLSHYQIQWKLISDNAPLDGIPIIEISLDREYIFGDMVTTDAEQICQSLEKHIILTDKDGNIPNGVFVRRFDDDSFIIVNMYGEEGIYRLFDREIYLAKYGVYTDEDYRGISDEAKQNIKPQFCVRYANDNIIRAMFINDQRNFEVLNSCNTEIRFAVRKDVSAYLDEGKINVTECGNEMSAGLRKLYGISEKIKQAKARTILSSTDDFKFYPSVFIMGDFTPEIHNGDVCGVTLNDRRKTYTPGEYFADFGKVEFETVLCIPEGVKAIELCGCKLYTAVSADGKSIGQRICHPYIFPVDKELCGKDVTLTVTQYSSIAPIFGDVAYFEEKSDDVKWRGTPPPENNGFGFTRINLIF